MAIPYITKTLARLQTNGVHHAIQVEERVPISQLISVKLAQILMPRYLLILVHVAVMTDIMQLILLILYVAYVMLHVRLDLAHRQTTV